MPKTPFKSVDDYIALQAQDSQKILETVRGVLRKALPKAEETISYNIPAYRMHGQVLIYFAGWKHHYSLYPAGPRLIDAFKTELSPYEISKGTIRFPLNEAVPRKLIADISKFRVAEALERAKSR